MIICKDGASQKISSEIAIWTKIAQLQSTKWWENVFFVKIIINKCSCFSFHPIFLIFALLLWDLGTKLEVWRILFDEPEPNFCEKQDFLNFFHSTFFKKSSLRVSFALFFLKKSSYLIYFGVVKKYQ